MRFGLITLFPEMFDSFLGTALVGKAIDAGHLAVRRVNPRDFTSDRHRTVDDTPYGGGSGMVLLPGPFVDAIESLDAPGPRPRRVLLTPQGRPFTQAHAARFAAEPAIALVCGRYEGFDERIRAFVDEEVSLGDFVMLGGEVAAMAILEAVIRLVPGVLGNEASTHDESHVRGLLEYPQYTRPLTFRGMTVPDVLRSGNHAAIARWRRRAALERTRDRRPDLFDRLELDETERAELEREEP